MREETNHGVDHVKLGMTGGVTGRAWDMEWHNFLLPDEPDSVFRLCRQREVPVGCHATNPTAVKEAAGLGCRSAAWAMSWAP